MDFLILRPLPPKTGYHFFEGGGCGGGQKFLLNRIQAVGTSDIANTASGPMVTQSAPDEQASDRIPVCRSHPWASFNPGLLPFVAAAGAATKWTDWGSNRRFTTDGWLRYHSASTWILEYGLPAAWGRICH